MSVKAALALSRCDAAEKERDCVVSVIANSDQLNEIMAGPCGRGPFCQGCHQIVAVQLTIIKSDALGLSSATEELHR